MDFKQSIQTKRVLEVYQLLLEQRQFVDALDFVKQIKFSQSTFSSIINGNRNAPASLQLKICEKFGVNPKYISKGIEPKFIKEIQTPKAFLVPRNLLSTEAVNGRIVFIIDDIIIKKHHNCKSLKDVAKKLKVNSSLLSQIPKYKTIAPAHIIQKLGMAFDVSADWILFNEGNAYRQHNVNSVYNLTRETAIIKGLLSKHTGLPEK